MKQSVLVTGASGFIGRCLCAVLKEQGNRVIALGRHPQAGPWDEFRQGDLAENLPQDLCAGVVKVFHLAGFAHAMRLPKDQYGIYQTMNVEGTRQLLERVRDSDVQQLVYFSSIKAMADPGEDCVDESFVQPPADEYGLSKLNAERAVLEFGARHAVHVCCLRPALVYGPNPKGNIQRMLNAIASGRFPPLPSIDNRRSMVSVDDLVQAALLAAQMPEANGKVYIVTDGQAYSTTRIVTAMYQALNKSMPKWALPKWFYSALAGVGDLVTVLAGRPAPFSSETLQRLFGSACYKNERIRSELGWLPGQSLEDVLPVMIESAQAGKSLTK